MLCIIVLNYNDYKTTNEFVMQIKNYECIDKIVIVDNASTDCSFKQLLHLKSDKIDVINSNFNGGYGFGNNYGIRYVKKTYNPKYIIISNPDVEVKEKTIENCKNFLDKDEKIAIAAPMMKNIDGTINYNCVWNVPTRNQYLFFSTYLLSKFTPKFYYKQNDFNKIEEKKEVGCVAGSFFMARLDTILKYGMYDENIFLYCEETVLGIKMKKAEFKTIVLLNDYFIHKHSISINKSINSELKQKKLTWNSRIYVLTNYYRTNNLFKLFTHFISRISILEYRFISRLKGRNI